MLCFFEVFLEVFNAWSILVSCSWAIYILFSSNTWIFTVTQSWRKSLISRQNETKYPFPFSTSLMEYVWEYMVLKGRLLCHRMERNWTTVCCPDSGLISSNSVCKVVRRNLKKIKLLSSFVTLSYGPCKKGRSVTSTSSKLYFNISWSYWIIKSWKPFDETVFKNNN